MSLQIHGGKDVGANCSSKKRSLAVTPERRASLYATIDRIRRQIVNQSRVQKNSDIKVQNEKKELDIEQIREYFQEHGI